MKKQNKTNKKIGSIIITVLVLLAVVLGFVLNKQEVVYKGLELHNPSKDLDFSAFTDKLNSAKKNELVFLTLFIDTKTDSSLYKHMLEGIIEEYDFSNYYVYYTNVMSEDENEELNKLVGGISGYPMTFIFKNKEVYHYIWGYQVKESYLEELKNKVDIEKYSFTTSMEEDDFFEGE